MNGRTGTDGELFQQFGKPCTLDTDCGNDMACLHLADVDDVELADATSLIFK